jgi:ribosomal protein L37E
MDEKRPRAMIDCRECGDLKPHAADGLCFACYKARSRREEKPEYLIDPHTPALSRRQQKIISGFRGLSKDLVKVEATPGQIAQIMKILELNLECVKQFIHGLPTN